MQLISKREKEVRFLLSSIDMYHKYTWVALWKDKKGATITNVLQIPIESDQKQSMIRVVSSAIGRWNHGCMIMVLTFLWLINEIMLLQNNLLEPQRIDHSIKNGYIERLDEIVDKYNNIYYRKIKIKFININSGICIDFGIEHNDNDPKLKLGDHVRIWICKSIGGLLEGLHSAVPSTHVISDINWE